MRVLICKNNIVHFDNKCDCQKRKKVKSLTMPIVLSSEFRGLPPGTYKAVAKVETENQFVILCPVKEE